MSKLDLRKLRAFVTVVEQGSISAAAERLFIQQPPLSRLLQGLEAEFGVALLHRQPRGVIPTDAGKVLLLEAQALLTRADQLEAAMQRAAQGKQGNITIGFTSSSALHAFGPELLRRYREIYPSVTTQLEEAGSGELLQAVVAQRVDVAFVRMPVKGIPELAVEKVLEEPMRVALPARHRLAGLPADEPISLKMLANESFVPDLVRRLCRKRRA
jgi:DNA-binding transcriptional LysR family regulator